MLQLKYTTLKLVAAWNRIDIFLKKITRWNTRVKKKEREKK
jgi:hypothetical protein